MNMAWLSGSGTTQLFIELFIKSSAVLAAAILIVLLCRKASASLKHFVLTFFLTGLLILPALIPVRLGWETGLLPARTSDTVLYGKEAGVGEETFKSAPNTGAQAMAATDGNAPLATPGPGTGSARVAGATDVSLESSGLNAVTRETFGRGFGLALSVIWAAGFGLLLLRLAAGLQGAHRLTREGRFVSDPAWRILLQRFLIMLGLRRTVRLKSHGDVAVPLTWGFLRPVILIPADHNGWTDGQRSSALLHELSHIKRADFLVTMIVRLSLAVFWWNPAAWVAFGILRKEQEKACDELVLRTGLKPSTYAANLLLFRKAAGLRWNPSAALLGLSGRASLNERLTAILKQKLILKEVAMKNKIMIGIVAVLAVAVIGMARPGEFPEKREVKADIVLDAAADAVMPVENHIAAEPESLAEVVVQAESRDDVKTEDAATLQEQVEQEHQHQEYQTQEKETQEKEKAEKKAVKTIVITSKEGKDIPLELTIIEGDTEKTIKAGKSVALKRGDKGELILLGPEGKEIEVLKGDPIRLLVKEGDIELLEGDKAVKVIEGGSLKLVTEKDKGEIIWVGKADVEPHVVVVGKASAEPRIAFIGEDKGKPNVVVKTVTDVKPHITWKAVKDDYEFQKKLEELRKTLEKVKAKELELSALEEALNKIEAELKERGQALKALEVQAVDKPVAYTIVKKGADEKGDAAVWISGDEAARPVTITTAKKGDFSMAVALGVKSLDRETYARIVDQVRKALPEGYDIEADYDADFKEKAGVLTLKIKGPADKPGVPAEVAEKLAEVLKQAIK